jgi:hypothetical protein
VKIASPVKLSSEPISVEESTPVEESCCAHSEVKVNVEEAKDVEMEVEKPSDTPAIAEKAPESSIPAPASVDVEMKPSEELKEE